MSSMRGSLFAFCQTPGDVAALAVKDHGHLLTVDCQGLKELGPYNININIYNMIIDIYTLERII